MPTAQNLACRCLLMAPVVTGCQLDYRVGSSSVPLRSHLDTGVEDTGLEEPGSSPEEQIAQASFNVYHQSLAWHEEVSGCAVQVAFYEPDEPDTGDHAAGQVVAIPDEPGTCAFTSFSDEGARAPMDIRGTVEAGDRLEADDGQRAISLERYVDDEGRTWYGMSDCQEAFPFGSTLSLRADGAEGGIPPFDLPALLAVGPALSRVHPSDQALNGDILHHSVQEPLVVEWLYSQEPPEVDGVPVELAPLVVIRNYEMPDNRIVESLACRPADDWRMEIPASELALLTPDDGCGALGASLQVDLYLDGPAVETSWGEMVAVRSLVTFGGSLALE